MDIRCRIPRLGHSSDELVTYLKTKPMSKLLKKAAVVAIGALSLVGSVAPAFAAPQQGTFRDGDGTIFMVGLSQNQEVLLSYPGTPKTASGRASACGAVTVKGSGGIPVTGIIKVDNVSIDTSTLSQQILPPCVNGSFQEPRTSNFKTYDGSIVVVGKTPNSFYAIETAENGTRRIRANACGIAYAKPNSKFSHALTSDIQINGGAIQKISDYMQKGSPICRSGEAYYPESWVPAS